VTFSEISVLLSVCTFARFRLGLIGVFFDTASRSLVQLGFVVRENIEGCTKSIKSTVYMYMQHVLRVFATRSQVGVSVEGWGWGYMFDAIFAILNEGDMLSLLEAY
jgi:hypothetical protein